MYFLLNHCSNHLSNQRKYMHACITSIKMLILSVFIYNNKIIKCYIIVLFCRSKAFWVHHSFTHILPSSRCYADNSFWIKGFNVCWQGTILSLYATPWKRGFMSKQRTFNNCILVMAILFVSPRFLARKHSLKAMIL